MIKYTDEGGFHRELQPRLRVYSTATACAGIARPFWSRRASEGARSSNFDQRWPLQSRQNIRIEKCLDCTILPGVDGDLVTILDNVDLTHAKTQGRVLRLTLFGELRYLFVLRARQSANLFRISRAGMCGHMRAHGHDYGGVQTRI